jgi:succinate dehydrogenase/fumarate reductase flavoprotein subunit
MTDTIIIGGGAAGCVAAIYAARWGKSVMLFEKMSASAENCV